MGLQRSQSHHGIISQPVSSNGGYRTHHIVSTQQPENEYMPNPNSPDALYAIQQMQRIKAATACQIINNRVVEAIRLQQERKLNEKKLKKKLYPNWRDPNETNPNNPAYKGPENAKLVKLLSKKKKKKKKEDILYDDEKEIEME